MVVRKGISEPVIFDQVLEWLEPRLTYFWSGPSRCFIKKFLNDLCKGILSCTVDLRPLTILESIKSQAKLIPFMVNGYPRLNDPFKHITCVFKLHRQHHPYQKTFISFLVYMLHFI